MDYITNQHAQHKWQSHMVNKTWRSFIIDWSHCMVYVRWRLRQYCITVYIIFRHLIVVRRKFHLPQKDKCQPYSIDCLNFQIIHDEGWVDSNWFSITCDIELYRRDWFDSTTSKSKNMLEIWSFPFFACGDNSKLPNFLCIINFKLSSKLLIEWTC